jgi:hypothetical protein
VSINRLASHFLTGMSYNFNEAYAMAMVNNSRGTTTQAPCTMDILLFTTHA